MPLKYVNYTLPFFIKKNFYSVDRAVIFAMEMGVKGFTVKGTTERERPKHR